MHNLDGLHKTFNANRPLFIVVVAYIIVRILFININYTEWGDTFRMIRAADYLSHGTWPWDEKRWPFYSVFLIPGIWLNAPVFWGRVLAILISAGSALLIYAFYLKHISKNKFYALVSVVFALMSSVFGYWSFRVMADPLFALMVLLYFYYFPDFYREKSQRMEYALSGLLLAITMTRLEGIFVAISTGIFFLIYSTRNKSFSFEFGKLKRNFIANFKSVAVFFVPQILIYWPWTLYAKVFYKGEVSDNYLDEVETFVFNFERFKYFFTYTLFILVIPITAYFVWIGIKALKNSDTKKILYFVPLALFTLQEFLIGFVWTPSLPRIYMPLIPFLTMLFVFGFENFKKGKTDVGRYLAANLFLLFLFAYLQYDLKLYFLGASKLLFGFILIGNLLLIISPILWNSKKIFITMAIILNLFIVSVVIYNQSYVYKSVMKGIEFVAPFDGRTAYSDETGNTGWYLRSDGYYLNRGSNMDDLSEQYIELKANNVTHLLWTDEFNRGSSYIDPRSDPRFRLLFVYQQAIRDPLDRVADRLNILDDSDYTVFTTKVYEVL